MAGDPLGAEGEQPRIEQRGEIVHDQRSRVSVILTPSAIACTLSGRQVPQAPELQGFTSWRRRTSSRGIRRCPRSRLRGRGRIP